MADSMGLAGLGAAAGAGDAMQTIFDQRMQAAKLAAQQQEFRQAQAQQDALTRVKYAEIAESQRQRVETARQANADRMAAENRMLFPLLPRTGIDAGTVNQMTAGGPGQGGLPQALFPPETPPPISAPAPPPALAPADQGAPAGFPSAPLVGAPDAPSPVPGTMQNAPMTTTRTFSRIPTDAEQQSDRAQAQQAAILKPYDFPAGASAQEILGFLQKQAPMVQPESASNLAPDPQNLTDTPDWPLQPPRVAQGYAMAANTENTRAQIKTLLDALRTVGFGGAGLAARLALTSPLNGPAPWPRASAEGSD